MVKHPRFEFVYSSRASQISSPFVFRKTRAGLEVSSPRGNKDSLTPLYSRDKKVAYGFLLGFKGVFILLKHFEGSFSPLLRKLEIVKFFKPPAAPA